MPRALLVDDEPRLCELCRRALSALGVESDAVYDGEEAIQAFDAAPYDAVVTDLRMPRRHGHSLAVELLSRRPEPVVFVLTGLAAPPLVSDLLCRGVRRVLHKPFDYRKLAELVKGAIDRGSATTRPAEGAAPSPLRLVKSIELSLQELTDIFADQLRGVFETAGETADPPAAVGDFIKRFAKQEQQASEIEGPMAAGRQTERAPCDAIALAVPVTRHFSPCGEAFRAAIRDISEGGLRVLHTRATDAKFLAIGWRATAIPAGELGVVGRVTRCVPRSPFYDIGVQFVLSD